MGLNGIINREEDMIVIRLPSERSMKREVIGTEKSTRGEII